MYAIRSYYGFDLRREIEASPGLGIKERTYAGAVAGQHQLPSMVIPQGNGELAIEMLYEAESVLLVEMHDDFGIGAGVEAMSFFFQGIAQFQIVEDFAVEHDLDAAVLVPDRRNNFV